MNAREANIYVNSISSKEEKGVTILHELYHAKMDLIRCRNDSRAEKKAEAEAIKAYEKRPEVLQKPKSYCAEE